jgi:hypothetical protein
MTSRLSICVRHTASALLLLLAATELGAQEIIKPMPTRTLIARRLGPAPTGLRFVQSGRTVMVSWDSTPSTAYRVYRGADQANLAELTPGPLPQPFFPDTTAASGTTYYYRVAAEYADGRIGTTDPTPYTVPPMVISRGDGGIDRTRTALIVPGPAPTNVVAVPAPTSVALSWPAMLDISGYKLERSVPAGSNTWTAVATVPGITFNDTGLDPDTPVEYRLTAQYADGRQGTSAPISTRTTKPVNPANLKGTVATHVINAQITPTWNASSVAYGDVNLSWDPVPGASYYEITGTGIPVPRTTPQTSFGIAQQPPGVVNYQVIAYFLNGTRRFGDAANPSQVAVLIGSPPVGGFGGVTYAGSGPGIVDFRWGQSNGATSFKLFRADQEYGPYAEVTNVSWATAWVRDYSSPLRGKTYYYKLVSIFPAAPIAWTPPLRIDIPTTVTLTLSGSSPGPQRVNLSWGAVPNATEYNILRGKGLDPLDWIKDAYGSPLKLGPYTTTYQDSGLWNGATYRYTVCAKISNGSACGSTSVAIAP